MKSTAKRFFSFLLMITVFSTGRVYADNSNTSTEAQPVAYWNFENVNGTSVPDASGNNNAGTLSGNASVVTGKFGKAVKFSASTDILTVPVTEQMNFTADESYTISMWVKPDSLSGWQCIFNKGAQKTESKNMGFWFQGNYFHYAQLSGNEGYYRTGNISAADDTWYKVVFVQDAAKNKAYMYVNGEVDIELNQSADATQKNANTNMVFGAKDTAGNQSFKGLIDEIKIYRTAIDATTVKSEYEAEINKTETSVTGKALLASWNFENATATSVPDETGNEHTGMLSGTASIKRNGKIGNAVSFSAGGDLLKIPHSEDFAFSAKDSYTVSMWFKADNTTGKKCLFAKEGTKGLGLYMDGNKLTVSQGTDYTTQALTPNLQQDEWYYISLVQDATGGKCKLYVDSTAVAETDARSVSNTSDWCFGASNAEGSNAFAGQLDEIQVYNYALTANEITAYYTSSETNYPDYAKFTGEWPTIKEDEVLNAIIDTDIGGDSDDLGAMAVFYYFAQQGKINPLAAISCSWQYSAPMLRAIGTYYGYESVPVAAYGNSLDNSFSYGKYITSHFETDIVDNQSARKPVSLYREVLAEAEDNSVTIIAVGTLLNVYDLFVSEPDEYSNWSGEELVNKKVKRLICMGGKFPEGQETNFRNAASEARYVNLYWPTPIVYCGWETANRMWTGARLDEMGGNSNPVSAGYRAYFRNYNKVDNYSRPSWDPLTVYLAANGWEKYYDLCRGDIAIEGYTMNAEKRGYNTFEANEKTGARGYLKLKSNYTMDDIATVLDQIFVGAERRNTDELQYVYVNNTDSAIIKTSTDFVEDKWEETEKFDNTYYLSKDAGATIEYSFNGSGILAYGTFGRAYGKIDVYIDNQKRATVDTYRNSGDYSGCLYAAEDLTMGNHTIKLVTADTKNERSTGYQVMLDFFKVRKGRTYTVTFDTNGGSNIENEIVQENNTLSEPTAPTRSGYHFGGWFNGNTPYDFTQTVSSAVTLTAKWLETGKNAVSITPNKIYVVTDNSNTKAYAAAYRNYELVDSTIQNLANYEVIELDKIDLTKTNVDNASLFIWNEKLSPLCEKIPIR